MPRIHRKHVVLISPLQAIHVTAGEHLGIGYLAAGLRQQGFTVEVIDAWLERLEPDAISGRVMAGMPPLCVGFSAYPSNVQTIKDTLNVLRENGLRSPCVGGGYGTTFHADAFLDCGLDVVVRGEGDKVFPQLCEYFLSGQPHLSEIPSISYRNNDSITQDNLPAPTLADLDTLPFPSRDTIHLTIKQKNPVNILSSKGCMGHCTFCSIQSFQRRTGNTQWRQRSIASFVDEIERLVCSYGVTQFKVVDDSLIEPPRDAQWCARLANELERRRLNVRLRGSIRACRVTDEIAAELHRAGFFSFACGIENFSVTALRRMAKSATPEQNTRALESFRMHGLYVEAGAILFDDRTTLHELHVNYEMMRRFNWIIMKVFTEMYAASGTPFAERLHREHNGAPLELCLGNYRYSIHDPQALTVYQAMKSWCRFYPGLYDRAINPLRAFRAITPNTFSAFYELYLELHERELDVFGLVLDCVTDGMAPPHVERVIYRHFVDTQDWYEHFSIRLKDIYIASHLSYDAEDNPFARGKHLPKCLGATEDLCRYIADSVPMISEDIGIALSTYA